MQNDFDAKINYTAADALNDALVRAGVTHVFLNSGTDYPPLIESWAKFEATGRPKPEIIISPHETAAFSAAQGAAQITGRAQAVFVHVDVGTQNLGGTIHNAYRCRVPVLVMAGLSPYTMEGELMGGRNAQIQFLQNVSDQASIVREYTKMRYELRTGINIQQMTYRALQIAHDEPAGPVYLTATREVLEEEAQDTNEDMSLWSPSPPTALSHESIITLCGALAKAELPLIITSYSGRNPNCVAQLEKLANRLAVPVIEMNQSSMNFSYDNPMHLGFDSREFVDKADLILVIDCDMPWIPAHVKPRDGCRLFFIDSDPIKENIPLWYFRAEGFIKVNSFVALNQLNDEIAQHPEVYDEVMIDSRRGRVVALHEKQRREWLASAEEQEGIITPEFLTKCLGDIMTPETVLVNEAITDRVWVDRLIPRTVPNTLFTSGGSSLGWHGGAALGMKLACPDKDIVAVTGDGTYIFSCPTAVYWMAAKYNAPFMTVIYNNQGWNAPKQITLGEHPDGYAAKYGKTWTSFDPPARLDEIARAAGGGFAITVSDPKELRHVLRQGLESIRNGKTAVINVMLPPV